MSSPTLLLSNGKPLLPSQSGVTTADAAKPAVAWSGVLSGDDPSAALRAVHGDFAVAVSLPSGRTIAAVDRFGVRTLCWRVHDGQLRVAARADELADAATPVDPQAIFDYLFFHAIPSPRTIFAGVNRLPPGHMLVFEHGQASVRPWWTPTFTADDDRSFAQKREEFLSLVEQAVRRRLDGTLPACFLSGGTDSSTVAGMIAKVAGQAPHTYSIGFEAEGYDEMAYARIAAGRYGTQHHEYYVTPADLVARIADVAGYYDQPFGNSSALPAFCCAWRARQDGVTHLLAGDGGDELFGGNTRYAKQRVFDWYSHVPPTLRSSLIEPLLERTPLGRLPVLRKGASYVGQAKVPMPDRLHMYNLLLRLGTTEVLTPEFLAQADTGSPLVQQRQVWNAAIARHTIDRTLAYDWRYTLAESDLPKVCMTTAMAGTTVAFPFLDDDLLAFSVRLPPGDKLRGLKLRWFFKEALRGFLPDEILTKKKHGFGLPFGVWALRDAPLCQLAGTSVRSLVERGLVRREFAEQLLGQLMPAHPGYYGEMVWILMMLEQWLQQHRSDYRVD